MRALGTILVDNESRLTLDRALPRASQTDEDVAVLRGHLRSQILSDRQNGGEKLDLWASDRDMRDFTRAVSWFLVQDVWAPPGRFSAEDPTRSAFHEQARQFPDVGTMGKAADGKKVALFNTGIRWNAFQRWAVFLGLATTDTTGGREEMLVPDPTVAIRDVVHSMARPATLSVRNFVKQLTNELPVLDGGRLQEVVTQRMAQGMNPVSRERLSPALSHALQRLSDEGTLSLEPRADSPDVMALANPIGHGKVVSRVVLA
ncbi:hypothetical protein ASD90_01445 [Terrabacter sp. Root181]|nr:hypothetical protein ASD90_01445 [Terrabacter sp. Root181]